MIINIFAAVSLPFTRAYARTTVGKILRYTGNATSEISLFFCSDRMIRRYNRRFLKRDRPTDVIAFVDDKRLPGYQPRYLGDVVISVDRANIQARERRHTLKEELCILIIHGILHLKGYRDDRLRLRKKMFSMQETIQRHVCTTRKGERTRTRQLKGKK